MGYTDRRTAQTAYRSQNPIAALAVSPDGRMLASSSTRRPTPFTGKPLLDANTGGSVNDDVHFWDLEKNQLIGTFPINQPKVSALAFSPDGKTLATLSWKFSTGRGAAGTQPVVVSLWDVATRQTRFNLEFRALNHIFNQLTMENHAAVAFNPIGGTLATGAGRTVLIWDLKTHESREMPAVSVPNSFLRSLNFSPNGETLLAGGSIAANNVGYTIVYDVRTGTQTGLLNGTGFFPCFTPDGKTLPACNTPRTCLPRVARENL